METKLVFDSKNKCSDCVGFGSECENGYAYIYCEIGNSLIFTEHGFLIGHDDNVSCNHFKKNSKCQDCGGDIQEGIKCLGCEYGQDR